MRRRVHLRGRDDRTAALWNAWRSAHQDNGLTLRSWARLDSVRERYQAWVLIRMWVDDGDLHEFIGWVVPRWWDATSHREFGGSGTAPPLYPSIAFLKVHADRFRAIWDHHRKTCDL